MTIVKTKVWCLIPGDLEQLDMSALCLEYKNSLFTTRDIKAGSNVGERQDLFGRDCGMHHP